MLCKSKIKHEFFEDFYNPHIFFFCMARNFPAISKTILKVFQDYLIKSLENLMNFLFLVCGY